MGRPGTSANIHLTEKGPSYRRWPRVLWRLADLGGLAATVVMVLSFGPALWIGFVLLGQLLAIVTGDAGDGPLAEMSHGVQRGLLLTWLTSMTLFIAASVGRRVLRAGRHQVLFLRRFLFGDAIQAVTAAVTRIGSRWRHATLDDEKVTAVGAPIGAQAMERSWSVGSRILSASNALFKASLVVLMVLAGAVAITAVAIFVITEGTVADRLHGVRNASEAGGGIAGSALRAIFAVFITGLRLIASDAIGCALFALLAGTGLLLLNPRMRAIATAHRRRTLAIRRAEEVGVQRGNVQLTMRERFGPRLVVVKVEPSAPWQRAVTEFAGDSSIALIDVSDPTESLLWEIDLLTVRMPRPCVFVAERSRAERILRGGQDRSALDHLRTLLHGREILTYTTDSRGNARFVRALRASYEAAVRQPYRYPSPRSATPLALPSLDAPVASISQVVTAGSHSLPNDWVFPWIDVHGQPELAPGEKRLFAFESPWFQEKRGQEIVWDLTTPVHVYVTDERVIWVSPTDQPRPGRHVIAGHLRHIWINTVVCRSARRRDAAARPSFIALLALSRPRRPRIGHSVEFGVHPQVVRERTNHIVTVATSASWRAWEAVMPGVAPPLWDNTDGTIRWDGSIGSARIGTPMLIGTYPYTPPDGNPDHIDPPYGTPPTYRTQSGGS